MKINTLKDLEKVVKLCRKSGIDSIKIDGIELQLGPEPTISVKQSASITGGTQTFGEIASDTKIPMVEEMSNEDLLFYSVQENLQNNQ